MSKKTLFAIAAAALALLALVPAAASANVYCVDDTPAELGDNLAVDPSCETAKATIVEGLDAAAISAQPDSVLIGPGDFTLPAGGPGATEAYYWSTGANTLQLRGSGTASTHLTMGATAGVQAGLWVGAPAGSSVADLSLTIPVNVDSGGDTGIYLGGAVTGSRLKVDGAEATNATGIHVVGTATLHESAVELPPEAFPANGAVSLVSGSGKVFDSTLRADTGVVVSGGTVTVERSRIEAKNGISADGGIVLLRDSLLRLADSAGAIGVSLANSNKGELALETQIEGVTIVGGAAGSTTGIRVMANDNKETADATIVDTVISGPAKALQLWADNGREATATVAYSNFNPAAVDVQQNLDGSGEAGTAVYAASNVTNLAPGFVDPAAGDFHLGAGSALLDIGDPAAPPAEETDIDGEARAAAASCQAAASRRDIGADEYVPACGPAEEPAGGSGSPGGGEATATAPASPAPSLPDTALVAKRRIVTAAARVKVGFRVSSTEAAAGFRCKVDAGPYRRCGARWSAWLAPGRHRIRAVAVGAAGADPSPAAVTVKVVREA